ncbi:Spy/CpxP family protein refolding chaperone [Undibacterium sp. RuTC16W]|uniref:Spy/CpxP family protein refolding chaperone n=1 Tax=Undibacterium sp. RuTC16W TaxID=3413048 RepID=UPI003BF36736
MSNFIVNQRRSVVWIIAGIFALLLLGVAGLKVHAGNMHDQHGASGGGVLLMGLSSPASFAAGLTGLPAHIDAIASLSEQQKTQTMEKVNQTNAELHTLQQRYQERNDKMLTLLTQEKIDEQAIERLRSEQLSIADQGSRRVTQLMVDLSKLLTPEQRQRFSKAASRHGSHG